MPPEALSTSGPVFAGWVIGALLQLCVVFAFSILPGWWFARRLKLQPSVRFLAAILISYGIVYSIETIVYFLRVPSITAPILCGLACIFSLVQMAREKRLPSFDDESPAWLLVGWIALALCLLAAQSRIYVHSPPGTYFDWFEHWMRSLFFDFQKETDTMFGIYHLAARGPLMNAVAAACMSACGFRDYWSFQIVATVLNAFPLVPMALLLRGLTGLPLRRAALVSALLLAAMPYFVFGATYTWTKMFTAGFIVSAIFLYWRGLEINKVSRCAWCFTVLAMGFMSHFLTFTYGVVLALHFIPTMIRRSWPWKRLVLPAAISLLLIGPWFGYLFAKEGVETVLTSNTTTGSAFAHHFPRDESGNRIPYFKIFVGNVVANFTPAFLRPEAGPKEVVVRDEENPKKSLKIKVEGPHIRSFFGSFNHGGIYWALFWSGCILLLLAAGMGIQRIIHGWRDESARKPAIFIFWLLLFAGGTLLNVSTLRWGPGPSFNVNFHALVIVVLVLAIRELMRLPPRVLLPIFAVFLIHHACNSWAHIRTQESRIARVSDGAITPEDILREPVYSDYLGNYNLKFKFGADYLADRLDPYRDVASFALFLSGLSLLWWMSLSLPRLEEMRRSDTEE